MIDVWVPPAFAGAGSAYAGQAGIFILLHRGLVMYGVGALVGICGIVGSMPRNEAETRAELIDPVLTQKGWGVDGSGSVCREYRINDGRIQLGGGRGTSLKADYVLLYKNRYVAVVEAKAESVDASEGLAQAKLYAEKLQARWAFSTNGKQIRVVDMDNGNESDLAGINQFPTPQELLDMAPAAHPANALIDKFYDTDFHQKPNFRLRYYQQLAMNKVLEAIGEGKNRVLLTLATGTGKTEIALQIVWKLFAARWTARNLNRTPRVLFLCDRNILANQAYLEFSKAFGEDQITRIYPREIRTSGKAPKNHSIYFTIFQTFATRSEDTDSGLLKFNFYQYERDFFDLVIVDECHRGGANDESMWRGILDHFKPAVQLGLTATPRRNENIDTYEYFGEPVYVYSLVDGINDGFLTPFKVRAFTSPVDDYQYGEDDHILEGETDFDKDKLYEEPDFNRLGGIQIKEREAERVRTFLSEMNPMHKTIVFCTTQAHALLVRNIINELKSVQSPNYCHRVTANDGGIGETHLANFQDNENEFPVILTTSRKLSTGVDAQQVRNIVLMRKIKSRIEFKQIIGRGTRLAAGKNYFTIYDFVKAHERFKDIDWEGIDDDFGGEGGGGDEPTEPATMVKIKLADGREITCSSNTYFWGDDGKMITAEEFLQNLYGTLPKLLKDEAHLRELWGNPTTRQGLLDQLAEQGFTAEKLQGLKEAINAQDKDLFDALAFIAYDQAMQTRAQRAEYALAALDDYTEEQRDLFKLVLRNYETTGESELHGSKFSLLLDMQYGNFANAKKVLGDLAQARANFIALQKELYPPAA